MYSFLFRVLLAASCVTQICDGGRLMMFLVNPM